MRITGGALRGRQLEAPQGATTRPTADRSREALFHVLSTKHLLGAWEQQRVVDLFAGSGALGIEALSRGAAEARFFEQNRDALRVLEKNLATLKLVDRSAIHRGPLVDRPPAGIGDATLVLCDPPYELDATKLLQALSTQLPTNALLCYEHSKERRPALRAPWRLLERRSWGAATVSIFRLEPAGNG